MAMTVTCLLAIVIAAGCSSSSKITSRDELVTEKLPRPAHIWVYNFAATAADLPANSALAGKISQDSTSQTAEHVETGRRLGVQIAAELVGHIRDMGMTAGQAVTGTTPQINDIVIRGCLISFDEGNTAKRVAIGFGSGSSNVRAAAEGFQVTAQGLRKLGGGTGESGGSKTPGAAVGVVGLLATLNPVGLIVGGASKVYGEATGSSKVEGRAKQMAQGIADVLEKRFKEQGWIK
jgi:hypothetical protein